MKTGIQRVIQRILPSAMFGLEMPVLNLIERGNMPGDPRCSRLEGRWNRFLQGSSFSRHHVVSFTGTGGSGELLRKDNKALKPTPGSMVALRGGVCAGAAQLNR